MGEGFQRRLDGRRGYGGPAVAVGDEWGGGRGGNRGRVRSIPLGSVDGDVGRGARQDPRLAVRLPPEGQRSLQSVDTTNGIRLLFVGLPGLVQALRYRHLPVSGRVCTQLLLLLQGLAQEGQSRQGGTGTRRISGLGRRRIDLVRQGDEPALVAAGTHTPDEVKMAAGGDWAGWGGGWEEVARRLSKVLHHWPQFWVWTVRFLKAVDLLLFEGGGYK